jgi:hypothetical protein
MYSTKDSLKIITTLSDSPAHSHQAQDSFSSTNAAHFGSLLTGHNHNPGDTLQNSVSPISYYNNDQSVPTQQLTAPYPIYRQPSRTLTDVSSLSSGFGDGDFVMVSTADSDNNNINNNRIITPPQPTAAAAAPHYYTARFSWMSQPQAQPQHNLTKQEPEGQQQRRRSSNRTLPPLQRSSTVYTQASEDQPARFRSVASWVNQQTGRIRRAQQRHHHHPPPPPSSSSPQSQGGDGNAATATDKEVVVVQMQEGIPGIPNLPPEEPSFGMMMDDEERPRKVESVVGKLVVS